MIATSSSLIPKKLTSSLPFQFNFANQFLQEPSQWTFQRHWNTGLVSSGASLTSWGGGTSLALVGDPSSVCVTINMPYGVDVLHPPALPCLHMEVRPYSFFRWCGYFWGPCMSLLWQINSQWGSQKLHQGLVSHELTTYLSIFNQFKLNELWPYYQKHVNHIILNHITL